MSKTQKDQPGYYDGVRLMPTPQVGDRVLWYDHADKSAPPISADVVLIEAPGRIAVKLNSRHLVQKTRGRDCIDGVRHMSDDCHKVENANSRDCGGWDWHRGIVPSDAFDAHRKTLERKEEMRLMEQMDNERLAAERKKLLQEASL
jgi:hypothetical protein